MTSDYAARSRQYLDALQEALGRNTEGVLNELTALVQRAASVSADHEHVAEALDALASVAQAGGVDAAVSEAAALFASPQLFREAIYFARCLDHDPASALDLMAARGYVADATVPVATHSDLATDQASVLEATSFGVLWREPGRLPAMLDMIDLWRREYVPAYQAGHAAHSGAASALAETALSLRNEVDALERLNSLPKLGAALGQNDITRFREIEDIFPCAAGPEYLAEALREAPLCPNCGFRLGDQVVIGGADGMVQGIRSALGKQQSRLSQRVVTPLLSRTGWQQDERTSAFVDAVKAGNTAAMARTLDDQLFGFIEDLLETPEPRTNLIDRLAREHPELTTENIDAVVESFRRIAADEVSRGGGRLRIGRDEDA